MKIEKKMPLFLFICQMIVVLLSLNVIAIESQIPKFPGVLGKIHTFSKQYSQALLIKTLYDVQGRLISNDIKQTYQEIIKKLSDAKSPTYV